MLDYSLLKKRKQFLAIANKGARRAGKALIIQAAHQSLVCKDSEKPASISVTHARPAPLFGFTASKKVGNAVQRNLAKRRMRSLVQRLNADQVSNESAYVLIAKPSLACYDFALLEAEFHKLMSAMKKSDLFEHKHKPKATCKTEQART